MVGERGRRVKLLQMTERVPKVSIIILTFNQSELILKCLESIKKYSGDLPVEIIIVDNGSSAQERGILKERLSSFNSPKIKLIELHGNKGFSKGCNLGANQALGKYLIFLNNDVIVTKHWLGPLVSFLEKHHKVAACQPKIHSYIDKDYFDYAGGAGGFVDMFGYPFVRGRVFDSIEKDLGQYDNPYEIFWATGACLVVRKEVFSKIGGFDEYFFAYGEEADLCVRLRLAGCEVFYVPESLVYHLGAATSNKNLFKKMYDIHRNHLYLVFKHYSVWPYFPLIIVRFLFEVGSMLYYLAHFKINLILAVILADLRLLVDLPYLVKKGVITWRGRSLMSDQMIYKGSIIIDYFFLGKRNFDQIVRGVHTPDREYKRYQDISKI